ncbi:MAG: ACT domain-containing protein [candidate division Zixibacteria bacterium]|nr:ACT domain-containing protein [candidate division Zixibacteria bacterium]
MVSQQGGLYEQIEKVEKTRIIIASFGQDRPGVVAAITAVLAELSCSIEDISQTLMQEFFSMIMVVNITNCTIDFSALRDRIQATETQLGMKVYVMHEDTFQYMHRI